MIPDNLILPKDLLIALQRYLLNRPMVEVEQLVVALRQLEQLDERTNN